jgi:hypothetical protein
MPEVITGLDSVPGAREDSRRLGQSPEHMDVRVKTSKGWFSSEYNSEH